VWAAPVLQSVLVPAAAASNGPILGGSCSYPSTCFDLSICSPYGVCGGPGAKCDGYPCLYGNCHKKVCGAPGATCNGDGECAYPSITGTCHNGVCGSRGAACIDDYNCKGDLVCRSGKCVKD
jgi:hypothetical protein